MHITIWEFFIIKKNVIYERAGFNMRKPGTSETVDSFMTTLYTLAEHCNYGALHDELIRDRLVVGLTDVCLSERMQLDKDLVLEKAIGMARHMEAMRQQQCNLWGENTKETTCSVDRVVSKGKQLQRNKKFNKPNKTYTEKNKTVKMFQMWETVPLIQKHSALLMM